MCWSTTRVTSTPASSRRSGPRTSGAQIETNLFGSVNVTRGVLPVMRGQRVQISSTAGIAGQEFVSAYAASKFAVEGWIESLFPEVARFGIRTMLVEPGFFRTELLTEESTNYPEPSIDDYAEKTRQTVTAWKGMNGLQGGDPARLAKALVQLASQDKPPLRWAAGADAVATFERKANELLLRPTPIATFHRRSRSMMSAAQTAGARSPSDPLKKRTNCSRQSDRSAVSFGFLLPLAYREESNVHFPR